MLVVTEQPVRGRGVIKEELKGVTLGKKRRKGRGERKGGRTRMRGSGREAFLVLII